VAIVVVVKAGKVIAAMPVCSKEETGGRGGNSSSKYSRSMIVVSIVVSS
jgi:hypothetical protein